MEIKALAVAAVAALSLGIAGTADAASPAPAASQVTPAVAYDTADGAIVQVRSRHHRRQHRRYRGGRRYRHHHNRLHFRFGLFFGQPYRYGYYRPWGAYGRCRRYYYWGFVRGYPYYRHLYYRYCY